MDDVRETAMIAVYGKPFQQQIFEPSGGADNRKRFHLYDESPDLDVPKRPTHKF